MEIHIHLSDLTRNTASKKCDFRSLAGIEPAVVSEHFKVDVALGRVGVATEGRTSQLGGSDGMLVENFELLNSIYS